MSVRSKIVFGNNEAVVDENGFLRVAVSNIPISKLGNNQIVYRRFLTLDNDGSTADMTVDGSTTPQLFSIDAEPKKDIFITSLSFQIIGTGIVLGEDFAGSGASLTNGCRLYYEDNVNGEVNIGTQLQNNFDFIRLCQGNPAFNDGAAGNASELGPFIAPSLTSSGGGKGGSVADGIIPVLDIKNVFGLSFGIKLSANTKDKLVLEVNDNLSTGLGTGASFNIIAYGFEISLEDEN
jgi:hypothetical protein